MADPGDVPDSGGVETNGAGSNHESPPGTPRWVIAFAVVAVLVVLAVAVVMVTGGHDPSRFQH